MTNLGLGVMIGLLSGNEKSVNAFNAAMGKTIKALEIEKDRWIEDSLLFTFSDETQMRIYDGGQSCCEHRFMHTDDALDDFVGTKLQGAEVRDGPDQETEWSDVTECAFLIVTTDKGQFTVVNYNEHNGYYGGFWIVAETVENDERSTQ